MKVQDIIRSVLDIIDQAEQQQKPSMTVDIVATAQEGDDELRRIQQVVDLLTGNERPTLANSPDERYAGIDAVTKDAGGGVNGPKHPADIRGEHPSLYPGTVHGAR
jgi:Trp operon repressor